MEKNPMIVKYSGEKEPFVPEKLRKSLLHSGAPPGVMDTIVRKVSEEIYEGMSTREIYNRAFALLRNYRESCASRYKLKKAIYELGPTGFPFEQFVSAVLRQSGHKTQTNQVYQGHCVSHEIDVVSYDSKAITLIECKFHGDQSKRCDVKVPLYIHSRFKDIARWVERKQKDSPRLKPGWLVTNTRFTRDALDFGKCVGLYLLSWNHPPEDSLKRRIDRSGLYPITVSTLLSGREKEFLLKRGVVLCKELLKAPYYLDHLGVGEPRKSRVLEEFTQLTNVLSSI